MRKYFIIAFRVVNDVNAIKRIYVDDEAAVSLIKEGWLCYRNGEYQVGHFINNELLWKDLKEETV